MIVVINFADDKFKQQQIDNCETAIAVGKADKVIGYRPEDIDEDFKESYKDIFAFILSDYSTTVLPLLSEPFQELR